MRSYKPRVAVNSMTSRPYAAILLLLLTVCNIVLNLIADLTRRSVAMNKQTWNSRTLGLALSSPSIVFLLFLALGGPSTFFFFLLPLFFPHVVVVPFCFHSFLLSSAHSLSISIEIPSACYVRTQHSFPFSFLQFGFYWALLSLDNRSILIFATFSEFCLFVCFVLFCSIFIILKRESDGSALFWTNLPPFRRCPSMADHRSYLCLKCSTDRCNPPERTFSTAT